MKTLNTVKRFATRAEAIAWRDMNEIIGIVHESTATGERGTYYITHHIDGECYGVVDADTMMHLEDW